MALTDSEDSSPRNIDIDRLQVGLFVILDIKWIDHPFLTNSFKIRDEKQLDTLRRLGLRQVRYDPARSDIEPHPPRLPAEPHPPSAINAAEQAVVAAKKARIENLLQRRQSVNHCENELLNAATTLKSIHKNLFARPQESVKAATDLVTRMADSLLAYKDEAIHALNDKVAGEDVYFHSLNTAVLAMLLARELAFDRHAIAVAGLGALFHDIGKTWIPDRILRKTTPLTPPEQRYLAQHPIYGEEIGRTLGLPRAVLDIIRHHHEALDGSGYPDQFDGANILPLTRIVTIVNDFDNLCNQPDPARSLTPHEALAWLFGKQRPRYDNAALSVFIHSMGVYPPGTVVRLSDDSWGLVMSVNVRTPLRPFVLVHDPSVPREEAILVNLEDDPGLAISCTLRPADLPRDVFDYLSPRRRIIYYVDDGDDPGPKS